MKIPPTIPALAAAFLLSAAAPASGQADFQFALGTGDARSDLVVDFAGTGSDPGNAYAFSYFYDPEPGVTLTTADLLQAFLADGRLMPALEFSERFQSFALNGFTYDADRDGTPEDERVYADFFEGSFAFYAQGGTGLEFLASNGFAPTLRTAAYDADAYEPSSSGVSGRYLSDGTLDGFRFADAASTRPAAFPAVIPEPASAAVLAGVGVLLLRRRRA